MLSVIKLLAQRQMTTCLLIRNELNSFQSLQSNLPALSNYAGARWTSTIGASYSDYPNLTTPQCSPLRRGIYQQRLQMHPNHWSLATFSNDYSTKIDGEAKAERKSVDRKPDDETNVDVEEVPQKLGLVAKFKQMFKKYWYVLVPVHCVTSVGWFAGFYYLSSSGVDIPSLLQSLHISESIISSIKDSSMGHLAIALVCYKLAGPLRYAVTIGGTTVSVKYLSQWGYIKPMPSKERIKQIYDEKKAQLKKFNE